MTEYTEITDSRLQSRVRSRYGGDIAALQALGFENLTFKLETLAPFSALLRFPVVLLMRANKEVLAFPFPLRLAAAHPLLVHCDPPAIADCMGLGIKLYTNFSDNSLLISSTLQSHVALQDFAVQHSNGQIIRTNPCRTAQEAWVSHQRRTAEMEAQGRKIERASSFADYVKISEREEVDLRSRNA